MAISSSLKTAMASFVIGCFVSGYFFTGVLQTLLMQRRATVSSAIRHHQSTQNETEKEERLDRNVTILCWVMTSPGNLDKKAIHVKNTWGRRMNKLIFMSSVKNTTFPTVGLNVSEGRDHLTAKSMKGFKYVYEHHFNDADWFMKADDDTYVIVENLRKFLQDKDPQNPIYYGLHFTPPELGHKKNYHAGGAGYVLSKTALRRLWAHGENETYCRQDGGFEDMEIGDCLKKLNVTLGHTADAKGRRLFHAFPPKKYLHGNFNPAYKQYDFESGDSHGIRFISDYPISFHYIQPQEMYDLEFYVYHLKPYGIKSEQPDIPVPV